MRLIIQRVKRAKVTVEKEVVGKIDYGALVLFGVKKSDAPSQIGYLVNKLIHLRMFRGQLPAPKEAGLK